MVLMLTTQNILENILQKCIAIFHLLVLYLFKPLPGSCRHHPGWWVHLVSKFHKHQMNNILQDTSCILPYLRILRLNWRHQKRPFISFIVLQELVRNTSTWLPEIIVPENKHKRAEKISKKLRKSAEFGFIFQEILFPV